jgi:hypothetical protein
VQLLQYELQRVIGRIITLVGSSIAGKLDLGFTGILLSLKDVCR